MHIIHVARFAIILNDVPISTCCSLEGIQRLQRNWKAKRKSKPCILCERIHTGVGGGGTVAIDVGGSSEKNGYGTPYAALYGCPFR
jgi:hypothetical protein